MRCFIAMPFDRRFDGIVQYVIRPALEGAGDEGIRADDIFSPGIIVDDVVRLLRACDYLIADITGRNANVFYELGFAHSSRKPSILITQDDETAFDVQHFRRIHYTDDAAGSAALRSGLERAIEAVHLTAEGSGEN